MLAGTGANGVDSQYPDGETLEGGISEAWWDFEVHREGLEIWRVHLLREREWWEFKGDWKVCGIEFRGDRPIDG